MNPNWVGVSAAILSFAAFFGIYQSTHNLPVKTRILLLMPMLVAAVPGAGFIAYYFHVIPETSWYYQFRSITGSELLVVLLGVAGGGIATLIPRWLLIVPLLFVVVFSAVPFIKPFIGPIGDDALSDRWDDGICLQSTPSTCGAASTATVLRHLGGKATERELAVDAYSYDGGTEAWYMARAARSRGYDVHFDIAEGFSPDQGLPSVVGVRLGSVGHFIAILGIEGDSYVVGDPLYGRELLMLNDLRQRYVFTGFHMRIRKR